MGVAPHSCDPETRRKKQHVMSACFVSVHAFTWAPFTGSVSNRQQIETNK